MARPTFESINWDLVRENEYGKLWAVRLLEAGARCPNGTHLSRLEATPPRVFLKSV
jgi:hypothetical protein